MKKINHFLWISHIVFILSAIFESFLLTKKHIFDFIYVFLLIYIVSFIINGISLLIKKGLRKETAFFRSFLAGIIILCIFVNIAFLIPIFITYFHDYSYFILSSLIVGLFLTMAQSIFYNKVGFLYINLFKINFFKEIFIIRKKAAFLIGVISIVLIVIFTAGILIKKNFFVTNIEISKPHNKEKIDSYKPNIELKIGNKKFINTQINIQISNNNEFTDIIYKDKISVNSQFISYKLNKPLNKGIYFIRIVDEGNLKKILSDTITFEINELKLYKWAVDNKLIQIDANGDEISEQIAFKAKDKETLLNISDAYQLEDGSYYFVALYDQYHTRISYFSKENKVIWKKELEYFIYDSFLIDDKKIYLFGGDGNYVGNKQVINCLDNNGKIIWNKNDDEIKNALFKNREDLIPTLDLSGDVTSIRKEFNNQITSMIKLKNGDIFLTGYTKFIYYLYKGKSGTGKDMGHINWVITLDKNGDIKRNDIVHQGEENIELYSAIEGDDNFMIIANRSNNMCILNLDKNNGNIKEKINTEDYLDSDIISNIIETDEGFLFGIYNQIYLIDKSGEIKKKKMIYFGSDSVYRFNLRINKIISTDKKDFIIISDLYNHDLKIESSIMKINNDLSELNWKRERVFVAGINGYNIDDDIGYDISYTPDNYTYRIIPGDASLDELNGRKQIDEIMEDDFIGSWASDYEGTFTFNNDGSVEGIVRFGKDNKKHKIKGTWKYDEANYELTIDSENYTTWIIINELGDDYFSSTNGYYYYRKKKKS